ncbi:hypothetical protein GCM10009613_65170 [Pseudonocardia kongjuensis]|uniref:Uncharacterized protein n=1 Tax=Pseudonocardia kongjuensis TaxID=102227 RepID=A0ABN1YC55_9PSEU
MDCAATLSSQVDGLVEVAVRRPGRAGDAGWWAAALDRPARDLDDGWVRRAGPPMRRASAPRALGRPGQRVTHITHAGSPICGPVLVSAASAALDAVPGHRPPRSRRSGAPLPRRSGPSRARRSGRAVRPRRSGPARRPPGSGVAGLLVSGALLPGTLLPGTLLPGTLLPGALLSGLLGAGRLLPAAGPGLLLVLSGLVLLGGAGIAARSRAARVARAREIAHRVRAAVLAAADRELIRRTLDAELVVGGRSAPWHRTPSGPGTHRAA